MPIVPRDPSRVPVNPAAVDLRPDVQPRARVRRMPPPSDAAPIIVSVPTPKPVSGGAAAEPLPSERSYEVGYGKPPAKNRFQKGQSGNPKGRPRGAKSLKTLARTLLTEKVTVRTANGSKRVSKMEAMLHKQIEKAFAGDMRANQSLLQLYASSVPDEPLGTTISAAEPIHDMDAHDRAVLEELKAVLLAQAVADEEEES
jgi:hypothetical protein